MAKTWVLNACVLLVLAAMLAGWGGIARAVEHDHDEEEHVQAGKVSNTLVLEHLIRGSWVKRGDITLPTMLSTKATIVQPKFDASTQDAIYELAGARALYKIRAYQEGGVEGAVYAYGDACAYYASDLQDAISISLDSDGHLLALDLAHSLSCKEGGVGKKKEKTTKTYVTLSTPRAGPKPFLDDYLAELERRRMEGGKGEEKSFVQKYWMFFAIPLVFMVMGGGGAAPRAS